MAKKKSPFKNIPKDSCSIFLEQGTANTIRAGWKACSPSSAKDYYTENKKKKGPAVCYRFKDYVVKWYYKVNAKASWYPGATTNTTDKTTTYTPPDNAYSVKYTVKPTYTTVHKANTISLPSFATRGSNEFVIRTHDVPSNAPTPTISVGMDNMVTVTVTATNEEIATGTDHILLNVQRFEIVNNKSSLVIDKRKVKIQFNKAETKFNTRPSSYYKVSVAYFNSSSGKAGMFTEYSDRIYGNPGIPTNLQVVTDTSTSAKATFEVDGYVDSYDVEYATEEKYLGTDTSFTQIKSQNEEHKDVLHHNVTVMITDLDPGHIYYFRARAKRSSNEGYSTSWCAPVPLAVGRVPGPPTTYSSKTAAEIGDTVNLYWVHNSQDGSSQVSAELELYINTDSDLIDGSSLIIDNPNYSDDYQRDKTSVHPVELMENGKYSGDTTPVRRYNFIDGDTLLWRVRTKGVYEEPGKQASTATRIPVPPSGKTSKIIFPYEPHRNESITITISNVAFEYESYPNVFSIYKDTLIIDFWAMDSDLISALNIQAGSMVEIYVQYYYGNQGYGAWSAMKQITMFQKPEAYISVKTGWELDPENPTDIVTPMEDLSPVEVIDQYPIAVIMSAEPQTQRVISYNLKIINIGGEYPITNMYGRETTVAVGEVIYQNYFDNAYDDEDHRNQKTVILYPSDVLFEDGQTYRFELEVYTNAGLSDKVDDLELSVSLEDDDEMVVSATVTIDEDNLTASIIPYCFDDTAEETGEEPGEEEEEEEEEVNLYEIVPENLTENVLMDVYRIETDGSLTLIDKNILNNGTSVFDQHPALDYARYRIIARKINSAKTSYCDVIDESVGIHSLVIEWDDAGVTEMDLEEYNVQYGDFVDDDDPDAIFRAGIGSAYSRGLLILPWNIDTGEEFSPDAAFVEYIGREHPVSYYGTQKGQTASWSTDIDKNDKETLFKLRRLARHMGDCYVREPFGTGYWANVNVNWTQTHNEPAIPVSIKVTRVEPKEENNRNAEVE